MHVHVIPYLPTPLQQAGTFSRRAAAHTLGQRGTASLKSGRHQLSTPVPGPEDLSASAPEQLQQWQRLIITLLFSHCKRCAFPSILSCPDAITFCQGRCKKRLGAYGIKRRVKIPPLYSVLIKTPHSLMNGKPCLDFSSLSGEGLILVDFLGFWLYLTEYSCRKLRHVLITSHCLRSSPACRAGLVCQPIHHIQNDVQDKQNTHSVSRCAAPSIHVSSNRSSVCMQHLGKCKVHEYSLQKSFQKHDVMLLMDCYHYFSYNTDGLQLRGKIINVRSFVLAQPTGNCSDMGNFIRYFYHKLAAESMTKIKPMSRLNWQIQKHSDLHQRVTAQTSSSSSPWFVRSRDFPNSKVCPECHLGSNTR